MQRFNQLEYNSSKSGVFAAGRGNSGVKASIWASLPIATLAVDKADCVVHVNPAAESLFNCSARQLSGQRVSELTDNATLNETLEQVRVRQSPVLVDDLVIKGPSRDRFLASMHIAPIQELPDNLLVCVRSREIEGKFYPGKSANAAARSAVGLADMLRHEIRNPLSGIVGAAQLLAMKLEPEDLELAELIVEEAYRIRTLLEQVDQFGQMEGWNCIAINVHTLLDRASRLASVGFASGTCIETEYDPSLPEVCANGDRLLQVFLNLLQNASEALGEDGGLIRIRTRYDRFLRVRNHSGEGRSLPVHVEVIDNGPGVSPEVAQHAFAPFVSGKRNGTGLGLALVSSILADIGGWVSFDSRPGQTTFRVSLPVASENTVSR